MISHKVPENHQNMKFWPNLKSFIGKWKITLFLDDLAGIYPIYRDSWDISYI